MPYPFDFITGLCFNQRLFAFQNVVVAKEKKTHMQRLLPCKTGVKFQLELHYTAGMEYSAQLFFMSGEDTVSAVHNLQYCESTGLPQPVPKRPLDMCKTKKIWLRHSQSEF